MSVIVDCPHCRKRWRCSEEQAKQKLRCPGCGGFFCVEVEKAEALPVEPGKSPNKGLPAIGASKIIWGGALILDMVFLGRWATVMLTVMLEGSKDFIEGPEKMPPGIREIAGAMSGVTATLTLAVQLIIVYLVARSISLFLEK